jgi:outer membrane receptor protein involved in Fe transport
LPSCGFSFTDNFGDAQSYGGELQLAYKPPFLRNLTLMLNAGGARSVITASVDPSAAAVGEHVLFVPEYTAAVSAEYRVNLNDHASIFARGDYQRIGKSYGSFQATDPDYINPEYAVVNARMGADLGSWQIVLWGKNLTNNQTIIQRPNVASVLAAYTVVPLTVGLTVSKEFR